jgi:hypothetical protein
MSAADTCVGTQPSVLPAAISAEVGGLCAVIRLGVDAFAGGRDDAEAAKSV